MLHLIVGRQGSGKTLYIVKMALECHLRGKTVYSNVHLHFPYKRLIYSDIVNCNLEDGVVIIDEAHLLLPSRNSLSKRSRKICDGFISMIRKKNLEVFMTTQMLLKIDIRIRIEKDFLYIATKYASNDGCWEEIRHNHDLAPSIPIAIRLEVIESFSLQESQFIFIGNGYFDLYDSRQIINIADGEGLDE